MTTFPLSFLAICAVASGATLSISPEVVYDCTNGMGRVTLTWAGASGPVEVRVNGTRGTSMTGLAGPAGSASSGDWVSEGMTFFLVNELGEVEAQATAHVRCGGAPPAREGSYYPLQVGNQWVYRVNSRMVTSDYVRYSVTGTEQLAGVTYARITSDTGTVISRLRSDSEGRIFQWSGNAETILMDPALAPRETLAGPLGPFAEVAHVTNRSALGRDERYYARGVGLVKSDSTMLTGSSGGFVFGLELVEARLDGGSRLALPASQLSLSIENTVLDVTGRKVTNCAVPSYCAACGLIGADPPGTFKPCVQARVEGRPGVELELQNAAGQTVFRLAPTQSPLRYVQVPLYSRPNEPLPPGVYTLLARIRGEAEAWLMVRID
jgi:hypothetical protein